MKPNVAAFNILSTTRATAKMHEFRVAPEDFIDLPRDPAVLFSLGVGLLGDVTARIANEFSEEGELAQAQDMPVPAAWGEDSPTPIEGLRFASIFFDAYLNARLDDTVTAELSLLCASAYYLSGSVGSAAVIVRRMALPQIDLAGGLGRLSHAILSNDHRPLDLAHAYADETSAILSALRAYSQFEGNAEAVRTACRTLRAACYKNGSPRELMYSDVIGAICAHKLRNAARTILPASSGLAAELWRPALARPRFPTELWPAQQRIASAGLLSGKSAVIQMPTSAGKTRATELVIRSAFLSKRASLAVIVAPYRSLCHDIRSDLAGAFAGEEIKLDEVSDAYQLDIDFGLLLAQETVMIVTPEKLLYMLRREPSLATRIGLVIYDEGHQFDGLARGPNYELLLTSLRMILDPSTQIVLISAVIGNASAIAGWLVHDSEAVVHGEGLLPTAKSIAFASWQDSRGRLEYVSPEDPDEREFYVPRIITDVVLANRGRETAIRRFPEKSDGGDVGLFLGLHVVPNGSVAIFCGLKASVAKLCRRVVDIVDRGLTLPRPVQFSSASEVTKIRTLSEAHLGADASATQAAALGVFAHHADTPHGLRLSIEHAMKEGLVKFVICTSTLAQGVNFPLRYLVVTSMRQGGHKLLVRDFHNLMGRAGRAGMHTEGSVIFSSPSVFDQRSHFVHGRSWQDAKTLLDASNSEPCSSSILDLFEDYVQRQPGAPPIVQAISLDWLNLAFADRHGIDAVVDEAIAQQPNISANEFRRFIEGRAGAIQNIAAFLMANVEFAEEGGTARAAALATNTLAYHLADDLLRERVVGLFEMIAISIIKNTDAEQRTLMRRSPLPPAAVADLKKWLMDNLVALVTAATGGKLLDALTEKLLANSSSWSIRNLSDRAIVAPLLKEWVAGRSFAHIHGLISKAKVRVSGDHATVEDAVALGENGFGYDVAMVLASMVDLVEPLNADIHSGMSLLQKQVKHGLTDQAAIAFLEAGFADRHVASMLGSAWPHAVEKVAVRAVCRLELPAVTAVLAGSPSYFTAVAQELAA